MCVVEEVLLGAALENIFDIAFEDFAGGLEIDVPRIGERLTERDARVVEAFLTEQVVNHQRLVDPWPHMRVPGVVLAEIGLHLSHLCRKVIRKSDEVRVTLLHIDPLRRQGEKEIRFGVRIDKGLKGDLGLIELHRRPHIARPEFVRIRLSRFAEEIADDGDVGIEDFRRPRILHVVDGLHLGERGRGRLFRRFRGRCRLLLDRFDLCQVLRCRRDSRGRLSSSLELVDLLPNFGHLPAQIIEPLLELLNALFDRLLRGERTGKGEADQQEHELTTSGHGFLLCAGETREGSYSAGGAREGSERAGVATGTAAPGAARV